MLLGILVLVACLSGGLLLVTGQGVSTAGQLGDAIGGHLNVVLSIVNIFVLFQIFKSQKQDARRELRVAEESALLPRLLELATIAGGMSSRCLDLQAKSGEWSEHARAYQGRLATGRDMHQHELPQWITSAEEEAERLGFEADCLQGQVESIDATVNAAIKRLHPQSSQEFLDLWNLYEIKRNSLVPGFGVRVVSGPSKA
jgi:hypothetical protein